jgi:hypothetical protein
LNIPPRYFADRAGFVVVIVVVWTDPLSLDGGAAEIRRPGGR